MGNFYRVMVTDSEGLVVIELAAPVEMLRQFAPSVVAAALGTSAQEAEEQGLFEPETEAEKPKRRRRTKAEMEAARAAAEQAEKSGLVNEPVTVDETVEVDEPEKPAYNPFG